MKTLFNAIACAALIALCGSGYAQADIQAIKLNINAPTMAKALIQFTEQSGLHLIFPTDGGMAQIPAREVVGTYTPEDALERLLSNTGLKYEYVDARTIAVHRVTEKRDMREPSALSMRSEAGSVRLAQGERAQEDGRSSEGSESEGGMKLEEIVVTAQKRKERLQDVPMAITVLAGEELDRSGLQGVTEALSRVPSVSIFEGGRTTITMRGVSAAGPAFSGGSPTGYYVDGVPFSLVKTAIVPDASVYDLERVEVLKGPQGTLYGANSINGVVRILTKEADLNDFELKLSTAGSSIDGGDESYRGDAAINVPLVAGKLAARAVVGYSHVGGWIDRPAKENANDGDLDNIRLRINAQPTDALSISASLWRSRSEYGAGDAGTVDDLNPFRDEPYSENFDVYALNLGYDWSALSFSSTTSYIDYRHEDSGDFGDDGDGNSYFLDTSLQSRVLSQEVLVNSKDVGSWIWSVGAFYRHAEDPQLQDFSRPACGTGCLPVPIDWRDISESFAVFGQVTRKLLDDRLELTGGLRYFEDKVEQIEDINFFDPSAPGGRTKDTFDAVTPRVVVTWHPEERHTIYGSYSQGFRSGFRQDIFTQVQYPIPLPAAEPDKLTNYEIGAKGALLGGRLGYEAAVYYLDWQDVQQSINVPVLNSFAAVIANAGSASGPGIDLYLTTRPMDRLELGAGFGYNDLTFDQDVISGGTTTFIKGSRLISSPEYTAQVSADYAMPLGGSGYSGRFSASVNYTSNIRAPIVLSPDIEALPGEDILLARAAFRIVAPKNWELSIFSENIANERAIIGYPADGTSRTRITRPRRIGLQVDYRFE